MYTVYSLPVSAAANKSSNEPLCLDCVTWNTWEQLLVKWAQTERITKFRKSDRYLNTDGMATMIPGVKNVATTHRERIAL